MAEHHSHCANCGAPVVSDGSGLPDFRFCPACHRRLLAIGSPACNYCGRRLPDEYIKARESDLKRIADVEEGKGSTELVTKVDELIRQTIRRRRGASSALGLVDITTLIDFFS
jgi:DNA-directed RNA polymerase subunit RPC12/RpoP